MHIALILPDLIPGGAQRVFIDLAARLQARGHRVSAIIAFRSSDAWQFPSDISVINLSESTSSGYNLTVLPALTTRLVRTLSKLNPDIALSTLTGMNLVSTLAYLALGRRIPVMLREASTSSNKHGRLLNLLRRLLYPRAPAIVAVSEGVADDILAQTAAAAGKVHVINNAVDGDTLRESARAPVTHEWLDKTNHSVFIAVGRLHRAKGFDTLLDAFARVRQTLDSRLIILGEGEDRDRLEAQAASLGIDRVVHMPGQVSNPWAYMARCDAFVLSSRWEGFVNALLEALALGLPVVATDCHSSPREILKSGDYGKLVPVDDSASLSEAMLETIRNPPPASHQQQRAADFTPERITGLYIELFNRVKDQHNSKTG